MTMLVETVYELGAQHSDFGSVVAYPFVSFLFMALYLYALTWITFACSIKRKKRTRIVAAAIARVFAFVLIPVLLAGLLGILNIRVPGMMRRSQNIAFMSPMVLLLTLEFSKREFFDQFPAVCANAGFFIVLTLILRARALRWARLHLRKG